MSASTFPITVSGPKPLLLPFYLNFPMLIWMKNKHIFLSGEAGDGAQTPAVGSAWHSAAGLWRNRNTVINGYCPHKHNGISWKCNCQCLCVILSTTCCYCQTASPPREEEERGRNVFKSRGASVFACVLSNTKTRMRNVRVKKQKKKDWNEMRVCCAPKSQEQILGAATEGKQCSFLSSD